MEMSNNDAAPEVKKQQSAAQVEAALKAVEIEEKQLDLEIKRENVARLRNDRATKENRAKTREATLQEFNKNLANTHRNCKHMKGGTDVAQNLQAGGDNASNYSVHIFKLPTGERIVLCTRCQMEWHAGDPSEYLIRFGRKIPNPTKLSYKHALVMASRSTNKESASVQFNRTKVSDLPQVSGEDLEEFDSLDRDLRNLQR
jgi:hypothetical protein